jgi:hypothetical protein
VNSPERLRRADDLLRLATRDLLVGRTEHARSHVELAEVAIVSVGLSTRGVPALAPGCGEPLAVRIEQLKSVCAMLRESFD